MNIRRYLLEHSNQHFGVEPTGKTMKAFSSNDNNPFPFLHNTKTLDDYIIYDIPTSFQLNILDYREEMATSITFNSEYEIFYRDIPDDTFKGYLHKQNFYELIYIVDGQLDITLEGKHHYLTASSFCITNRNVRHLESRQKEFTAIYICFKPEFLDSFQGQEAKHKNMGTELQEFFVANQSSSEQIDYLIFQPLANVDYSSTTSTLYLLFEELLKKDFGYLDICKIYLQRLFYNLQKPSEYLCLHTCFSHSIEQTVFEQTLKYIFDAKRKVTREEIGIALNYNGNYISRVFQETTGQTLAKYVRDICLSHAAHLLLNTNMQIHEIISLIGYENKTVFYKNFKEKYNMTPGEYRLQLIRSQK